MKTFFTDIIPKIHRFSKKLDDLALLTRIIHKQLSKPVWTRGLFEFVIFPEKLVLFDPLDSDKACFWGLLM